LQSKQQTFPEQLIGLCSVSTAAAAGNKQIRNAIT
jgi:hypothetical protein